MALTVLAAKNAEHKAKSYRLTDERGLHLFVTPTAKLWRYRYRFHGREKLLSFGRFPLISLAEARKRRDAAWLVLQSGKDPSAEKKANKNTVNSFEEVAREWLEHQMSQNTEGYRKTVRRRLELYAFPRFGPVPVADLDPQTILAALRHRSLDGKLESAHRVLHIVGQVMRYAVQVGKAKWNPTHDLRGALPSRPQNHMAAPANDQKAIARLLRLIDCYEGGMVVQTALRLLPLIFARPGEFRCMKWSELDLGDNPQWSYFVTKTKQDHIVPLSKQAKAMLVDLKQYTGACEWVFPSARTTTKPMSNSAMNVAMRSMGITKEEFTGHGWRSIARTQLHEQLRYEPDIIEHQLAHKVPDRLGGAYNRTKFIDERRKMMQDWADYIDRLRKP